MGVCEAQAKNSRAQTDTLALLIPSLFKLYLAKQLPENFVVLGVSRSDLSDEAFRDRVVYKSKYLTEKMHQELHLELLQKTNFLD